ncbi:OmpA family protein [Xanthobacteraceae bacterium A53D]
MWSHHAPSLRPSGLRPALLLAGLALAAPLPALAQDNPLTHAPTPAAPPAATAPAEAEAPSAPPPPADARATDAEATAEADARSEAQARSPSATEIIRSLAPFADGNRNVPRDQRDVDADGRRNVRVDYRRAIDLTVFFRFDSAVLTPEAKIQLEPLGNALRSRELAPYAFLVAGHTDAKGDAAYNFDLSRRRAEAVRRYLITEYGIVPSRLLTRGWGAGRLKDADKPYASVNRRVEVALIVPDRRSQMLDDAGFEPGYVPPRFAQHEALPSGADTGWHVVGRATCNGAGLYDPRRRLASDALDDFHAAPTSLCDLKPVRARFAAPSYGGWTFE